MFNIGIHCSLTNSGKSQKLTEPLINGYAGFLGEMVQVSEIVLDFEEDPLFIQQRLQEERLGDAKKKDRRFKTVVCRHWVKGLCMKLDNCEFLHELNSERIRECRWDEN